MNVTLIIPLMKQDQIWKDQTYEFLYAGVRYVLLYDWSDAGFKASIASGLLCVNRQFEDVFDVDHFIDYLREDVRIVKEVPPHLADGGDLYTSIRLVFAVVH